MTPYERQVVDEATAAILSVEPRARVILYGSRARGEAHAESDFDLLVVTPGPVTAADRDPYYAATVDIDLKYGELTSLLFVPAAEWRARRDTHFFLREVLADGISIA